jgi:non-reducing end alpha-L-arabinofuranosidase
MKIQIHLQSRSPKVKLLTSLTIAVVLLIGLTGARTAHAQSNRPCDIYAAASPATPCVAAFSTTRALYASYTGSLYQVTRQSDSTTSNIGVLSDGYANAAIQDAFCANTTCTITKIYDQSSNHNDLTPAPPGGERSGPGPNGYDLPASATALPVIAGGHKVYGVLISSEVGYRNDATKNIAVHGAPEGVYEVSSTVNLSPNNSCCFDFGNVETNNRDNGDAHMDALRLQCVSSIITAPCAAQVGLDMENGTYGTLSGAVGTLFVTAMAWNDGQHSYGLYVGNAQSGGLAYSGSTLLPSGYQPMSQEGAIVLGTGGDNSNWAQGYFFEGVMTAGAPTSTTMGNVQANIVAVGYLGARTLSDGVTYTFTNQNSQMNLDNFCDGCSGSPTNGVQVIQYPANGLETQEWTLHSQGNGYFTMVNVQSGMCLDDPWGNGTPSRTLPQSPGTSTMLWQQPCNGNEAQNWEFIPQSNSYFVIENQASTDFNPNAGTPMVIDDYFGEATQGLQMWLDTANGQAPQNWLASLPPNASGSPSGTISDGATYTLENQASQMLLDNYCDGCSGGATNGVQVIQYPANGLPTQKWTLHSQGNGYFTMVSVQSGMCLDDPWGNGTPSRTLPQSQGTSTMLWQQPCNGNAAQNWKFIPQSNGYFVVQNQAATTNNGSSMVIDDYNGQATQGLQMWLDTANGQAPQNWSLNIQ